MQENILLLNNLLRLTKELTETYHAKLEERDNQIAALTAKINELAQFARVLESFTPDQVQKISGASPLQMQQLHDAEDSESDSDTAESKKNPKDSKNLLDGNHKDNSVNVDVDVGEESLDNILINSAAYYVCYQCSKLQDSPVVGSSGYLDTLKD